jgi:hypothetical protein
MKNIMRNGALALSLMAGAALIAVPTVSEAKSIQRDGYFGGTWGPIGQQSNSYVKRHYRGYYGRGHYAPRYYQSRRYGYYGQPYYYDRGPGFSITIR